MVTAHLHLRAAATAVAGFVVVVVAAGGTFAASNPATLYACYDVYGNVRMGDTPQCRLPGGRLVYWNTAPVPGPTGPKGATGPTGPVGISGYEVVHTTPWKPGDGFSDVLYFDAPCPPGKLALGGGGFAVSNPAVGPLEDLVLAASYTGSGSGWIVGFKRSDAAIFLPTESVDADVWVVCATVD